MTKKEIERLERMIIREGIKRDDDWLTFKLAIGFSLIFIIIAAVAVWLLIPQGAWECVEYGEETYYEYLRNCCRFIDENWTVLLNHFEETDKIWEIGDRFCEYVFSESIDFTELSRNWFCIGKITVEQKIRQGDCKWETLGRDPRG